MSPKRSKSIHYRNESGQNPLEIVVGQTRRVQAKMSLDDFPERLDRLVAGKLKSLVLNIHLAESL
jgi:hypothetical protein